MAAIRIGCRFQYLSSAGVGSLTLVDGDRVELSNLQRQPLYRDTHIGKYKAEVAKDLLEFDGVTIQVITHYLDENIGGELVQQHDLITVINPEELKAVYGATRDKVDWWPLR